MMIRKSGWACGRVFVGALAVAGPSDRVPDEELEPLGKLVLEGAKEISGSLGCRAIDALYHAR